jgi:hypothetical protein
MNTPLDIAVDIGRIIAEAQTSKLNLDLSDCADELASRFSEAGVSRRQILAALRQEAEALGVVIN